jgi:hypothetical protein
VPVACASTIGRETGSCAPIDRGAFLDATAHAVLVNPVPVSNRFPQILAAFVLIAVSTELNGADPIITRSPFLPPSAPTESAPTADATLELRGIMAAGEGYMFSIYDSTSKSSAWSRLNETGHPFVVRSHDESRDSVTVEHQGRTLTLALRTAKVASAPVNVPQPVQANQGQTAPQPIGGPVVLNPSPADEQRRLEAIAAEVNRRRMIRQQALQASRQAGPGNQPQNPNSPPRPNPNQQR